MLLAEEPDGIIDDKFCVFYNKTHNSWTIADNSVSISGKGNFKGNITVPIE